MRCLILGAISETPRTGMKRLGVSLISAAERHFGDHVGRPATPRCRYRADRMMASHPRVTLALRLDVSGLRIAAG
jgi:hypothetical protein